MQDGRQRAVVAGHADHVQAIGRLDVRVVVGQRVQHAAARAHFLHVAFELFQQRVVGRHGDHRHAAGDQRQRAVLEFAGGIRLGVDVGDFFQLQRAFLRHRVVQAAAEEQRVFFTGKLLGPGDDLRLQRQHGLQRAGQVAHGFQVVVLLLLGQQPA